MTFEKHEHAKQTRKANAQTQYLLILLYSSNHNILKSRSKFDEQDLKIFKRVSSSQKLLWISKQRRLLLIFERFWNWKQFKNFRSKLMCLNFWIYSIEQFIHCHFINEFDQLFYIIFYECDIFDLDIITEIRHRYN